MHRDIKDLIRELEGHMSTLKDNEWIPINRQDGIKIFENIISKLIDILEQE